MPSNGEFIFIISVSSIITVVSVNVLITVMKLVRLL